MGEWITGRNPVYEVLRARRRHIFRLWVAKNVQEKGRMAEIMDTCEEWKIPIEYIPRHRLDSLSSGHQGVALEVSGYPYQTLNDIFDRVTDSNEPPFLLILDTLQDPQNLGTLLRTAEVVGVHGVLLPLRRTATVTPAVVSASSGASEHLFLTQTNLAQAIRTLKGQNVWIIGLEGSPEARLPGEIQLDGPIAMTIGNEAQGIRPLIRKSCDLLLQLPMRGRIDSLNAAVAGSIALYMVWEARGYQKR